MQGCPHFPKGFHFSGTVVYCIRSTPVKHGKESFPARGISEEHQHCPSRAHWVALQAGPRHFLGTGNSVTAQVTFFSKSISKKSCMKPQLPCAGPQWWLSSTDPTFSKCLRHKTRAWVPEWKTWPLGHGHLFLLPVSPSHPTHYHGLTSSRSQAGPFKSGESQ